MSIQLDKREDVDGSIWFHVRGGDNHVLASFKDELEARQMYAKCVDREEMGYPKFTILANSSIDGGKK